MPEPIERSEFEAALERTLSYLADSPQPGSPADRDFDRCLGIIQAYTDKLEIDPPERPWRRDDALLGQRLQAFTSRVSAHQDRAGEGIGPTLGMNLDRD